MRKSIERTIEGRRWVAIAAVVACVAGCDTATPPPFRLNMVTMISEEVGDNYQQEIADVLAGLFGTPDDPRVLPDMNLDERMVSMAAGPAWSDDQGIHHGLYRKHCAHCHGVSGDGQGPTGRFLNPYPRDYRPGVYKFKSTYLAAKPTDEDLHRVLINGIPGSAMPSFALLPKSEVESLVEYVKYLSIRGEMETELVQYVNNELGEVEVEDENGNPVLDDNGQPQIQRIPLDPANNAEQRDAILEALTSVVENWSDANNQMVVPTEEFIPADDRTEEEIQASIAKGRELFFGKEAQCVKCHGPTGLGDGGQVDQNIWNKAIKTFVEGTGKKAKAIQGEKERLAELDDDEEYDELSAEIDDQYHWLDRRYELEAGLYPVRDAQPRNLRKGVYRGGRRRIDIFWRIYTGIAGTPMPGGGPASPGAKGALTEEEIWHIVDYVLSLPYEPASQPQKALPVAVDQIFQ